LKTGSGTGTVQHLLDLDPRNNSALFTGGAKFTPNGKAVVYPLGERGGVWNLWMQPLDGSPGHQITNFRDGQIADFSWSPDGATLAVAHVFRTSDVVLFREGNP
jgi:Tol biopolymer transport system component